MKIKSFAKINLTLDSLYKRNDGYHEIDSIMTKIDLFDTITLEKNSTNTLNLSTNYDDLPTDKSNLVYKTYNILKEYSNGDFGVDIYLDKKIPMAAGLAGGSSNAAYTMIGLNKLYNLGLSKEKLMELAISIGADVPFFFCEKSARARGIGEKLEEFDNNLNMHILLLNDGSKVSSKFVYDRLKDYGHIDNAKIIEYLENGDKKAIHHFENVMENVVYENFKNLKDLRDSLLENGATKALLSGSGASIFAIFDSKDKLDNAKKLYDLPLVCEVSIWQILQFLIQALAELQL